MKAYRDVKNSIDTALERGREEGRAEGLEEGKNLKAIQIAKKMPETGMDMDSVMKFTGLTKEEIENL